MPLLDFTSFSGAVPRYGEYAAVEQDGMLFIVPDKRSRVCRYDPFEDVDGLLRDVTRAGAAVADYTPFAPRSWTSVLPIRCSRFGTLNFGPAEISSCQAQKRPGPLRTLFWLLPGDTASPPVR